MLNNSFKEKILTVITHYMSIRTGTLNTTIIQAYNQKINYVLHDRNRIDVNNYYNYPFIYRYDAS